MVVDVDWFFLSHRLPVAIAAQKAGWNVTVVTADTGKWKEIEEKGLKVRDKVMRDKVMRL